MAITTQAKQERLQRTYVEIFVLSQIVVLSPLPKEAIVIIPFLFFLYFFFKNPLKRLFEKVLVFLVLSLVYLVLYLVITCGEYHVLNYFVSFIFYGSFIFPMLVKAPDQIEEKFKKRIDVFIERVIVVEAIVGILQVIFLNQGFDLASGDYVQGTINPFSVLNNDNGFANIFFAINQVSLLTYYILLSKSRKKWVIVLCCLSIFLASCLHISISIILGVGVALGILNMVKVVKVLGLVIVFIGVLYFLAPRNLASFISYKQQIVESKNLKVKSTINSVPLLFSSPQHFLFGYGLGQYGSRASLIMSGKYFYDKKNNNFKNPIGISNINEDMEKVLMPLWIAGTTNEGYGRSVMNRPVYSIQSIVMEIGPIIFLFLMLALLWYVGKLKKKYSMTNSKEEKKRMLYLITMVFFIMFIALFENYLEIAQAIFPTLVLVKIFNYKSPKSILLTT